MRSQRWLAHQRSKGEGIIRTARERGSLTFADIHEAFDCLAHEGPTCDAARQLADLLRPVPLADLISASDEGVRFLVHLGERIRSELRTAPADALRKAVSLVEATAALSVPAAKFVRRGDSWIDKPRSGIASVALVLQALEWAIAPPSDVIINY